MKDNVLWQLYAGNYHPSEANSIPNYTQNFFTFPEFFFS